MACLDSVLNTLVHRSSFTDFVVQDTGCRACHQARYIIICLLSACSDNRNEIDETPVLLYATVDMESVVEN